MATDTESQVSDLGSLTFSSEDGYSNSFPSADAVNVPVDGWDPASSNPAAKSWADVLAGGFSRLVDAKTRPPQLNNTAPVLARPNTVRAFTGSALAPAGIPINLSMVLLLAVVVGGVYLFARK